MPKGLPDSVIYTAVKRSTRRSRKAGRNSKPMSYYQDNADIMNRFIDRLFGFDKKK